LHNSVLIGYKKPLRERGLKGSYLESCRVTIVRLPAGILAKIGGKKVPFEAV
jgi:hypothetical protein